MILNCIEPVFWLTLIALKFMAITQFCTGEGCGVSWAIAVFSIAIL